MGTRIGLVGATGLVGETILQILGESDHELAELRPFASAKSVGKTVELKGKHWPVETLSPERLQGLDVVFFSSGDDISKEWAPIAVNAGAVVIDNSAAFRMDPEVLLCVPEINGHLLEKNRQPRIIANPNCSTIQLVVALNPLAQKFGLESVRVATYQSVSGAGREGIDELIDQTKAHLNGEDLPSANIFPHIMSFNALPQIGSVDADGYCSEETKIVLESQKILGLPNLPVSPFTVRVPTLNVHSEAVWVTLKQEPSRDEFVKALSQGDGLIVDEGPEQYPHKWMAHDSNQVRVGRIRKDKALDRSWQFWVVADNLRKGAAYNAYQIAQRIF